MVTYADKKSQQIADAERKYDLCVEFESEKTNQRSFFFLQKMREIIFCRNHGLPTTNKEKNLRTYRDSEVSNK